MGVSVIVLLHGYMLGRRGKGEGRGEGGGGGKGAERVE